MPTRKDPDTFISELYTLKVVELGEVIYDDTLLVIVLGTGLTDEFTDIM